MSGSPKYSIYDLAADIAQMLQAKHKKAMQSQGIYREEEEKRLREERMHKRQAAMAYNLREQKRAESLLLFEKATDRITALKADEIVMHWMSGEIGTLENKLAEISAMIDRDELIASQTIAAALLRDAEDVVRKAEEMQLFEDRRQYVVQGVIDVMGEMGFIIQAGYPAPEYSNFPSSATIIQATRLGGGDIAVSIPQQGEMWYEVNGFPMQTEEGNIGQAVYTCDAAENEIEKIHNLLEASYGIQMGELRWEGKDPQRIKKAADCLPNCCGADCRRMS